MFELIAPFSHISRRCERQTDIHEIAIGSAYNASSAWPHINQDDQLDREGTALQRSSLSVRGDPWQSCDQPSRRDENRPPNCSGKSITMIEGYERCWGALVFYGYSQHTKLYIECGVSATEIRDCIQMKIDREKIATEREI